MSEKYKAKSKHPGRQTEGTKGRLNGAGSGK